MILFKGGHVLTLDKALGDFEIADVLVSGSKIAEIGPNLQVPAATVIDATDTIVAPGFVDTHRHLWEGLIRNLLPDATLQEYLRDVNGRLGPAYRPSDVYAGTLVSALSALNAGVTCVLDWAQVQNSPEHTDGSVQALQESGIRAVFGYGFPTVDTGHSFPEDLRRLRKGPFASEDQLQTLALATFSPEMAPDDVVKNHWALARELGVRLTVHAGIQGVGTLGEIERYGREGLLRSDTTYIHCASLNATEWRMIADTGGTVSIAAPIELQMGHGNPPIQQALDAGLRPSLSVDVETSIAADFFTQMRSVLATQRGAAHQQAYLSGSQPALLTAREVLEFATIEGARANGLNRKIGTLSPGKDADIILLRTDRINVMPFNRAVGAIVSAMDTSNVDTVMVAGKIRKRGGQLVDVDPRRIRQLTEACRDAVLVKAGIEKRLI